MGGYSKEGSKIADICTACASTKSALPAELPTVVPRGTDSTELNTAMHEVTTEVLRGPSWRRRLSPAS